MTSWKPSEPGEIPVMRLHRQPRKTWQHLYNEPEHWERLCDADIAGMRSSAESALGVSRAAHEKPPRVRQERWLRGKPLLEEHYRTAYEPTYLAEMKSPGTAWAPKMTDASRVLALTPNSVVIVVDIGPPHCIVTAFRPHDWWMNVDPDEGELRRHGKSYFRGNTGMSINDHARHTVEELHRVSAAVPRTVSDLRWLVSAVGFGRLLAEREDIKPALQAAERVLGEVADDLVVTLRNSVDWDGCLMRLGEALKDPRPEDAEDVLTVIEELMAMADPLGIGKEADALWEKAEDLVAWLPAEWHHLSRHAASRRRVLGDPDHRVARLWMTVEEAVLGAVLRETEPEVRPEPRYLDLLIPEETLLSRWLRRIRSTGRQLPRALGDFMAPTFNVGVQQPQPIMGGEDEAQTWQVHGRPAGAEGLHFRAFVVDSSAPEGCDVTDRFNPDDGYLWDIDHPDEPVLFVVVGAQAALAGDTLDAVLAGAESREDAFVDARELQPTQVTKADV